MVVQTAARNKNWRLLMHCLLTLLKYTVFICSCTLCLLCSSTSSAHAHCALLLLHSLLIPCTQQCTTLHNLCSSCFEFWSTHPTVALLNADHAQTTSDHAHTTSDHVCMEPTLLCSEQPAALPNIAPLSAGHAPKLVWPVACLPILPLISQKHQRYSALIL